MKDENEIIRVTVSNKQTAIFIAALVGYPAYFGLPANAEVGGHGDKYVLKLENRLAKVETRLKKLNKDMMLANKKLDNTGIKVVKADK